MSKPLPFWSVIDSAGIHASGTAPNSKPRLVIPRKDMDRADTGPIMRANIGRIVAAAEKRERKAAKRLA